MPGRGARMGSAREDAATTAEEAAEAEQAVARHVRRIDEQRAQGRRWASILEHEGAEIFDLLRRGARLAVGALSAFSSLVAEELSEEGASRRQIARLIGVTHQRVSAIIGRTRRGAD